MCFANFVRTEIGRTGSVRRCSSVGYHLRLIQRSPERYGKAAPPPTTIPNSLLERIAPYLEILQP